MSQCDSTNQDLEIVKGDDRTLTLSITAGPDELPVDLTSCSIYLTAKEKYSDADGDAKLNITGTITEAAEGKAEIVIPKTATNALAIGNYYYDIKLKDASNEVLTIIRGVLNIVWSARNAV